MRLLFVLENYLPHIGGVEIVFKNLCEGLARRGHKVTVITHLLPNTKRRETINGVTVIRVPCLDSRYLFTFAAIPAVIRHAKDADVIHTTTYNAAFPAWLGAVVRKKPKIITIHEVWLGRWREYSNFGLLKRTMHEFLEWCVFHIPRFDRYACVSHSTHRMLEQALPSRRERMLTIQNGFDDDSQKPDKATVARLKAQYKLAGRFVIFASGRPGTTKGFEYLVDAFPMVKRRIPNAVLLLMLSKDAQYRHKVDEFKARSGKDVIFIEPQPYRNVPNYRALAHCVVVPSTSEGFGYTVLEAAASGIPLVATDTTSIPEVIWGKHVLVQPKSAQAIADGIVAVSKGKYKTTKRKSFPWTRNIAMHERIYKELQKR